MFHSSLLPLNLNSTISAFFADFERQTQGENFSSQPKSREELIEEQHQVHQKKYKEDQDHKEASKDDMNNFFDEFEKTTGGENFRIRDG